eukprot:COSAG06_NODE_26456_length_614_cov_1.184466_1_plen_178_part_10
MLRRRSDVAANDDGGGGDSGKKVAIAKLRPKLEPVLMKQGLTFEDVVPALELVDTIEELEAALSDPEAFLQSLESAAGPAAKRLVLSKLRPKLEPRVTKHGLSWEDVLPAIDMISSIDELQSAIENPERLVAQYAETNRLDLTGEVYVKLRDTGMPGVVALCPDVEMIFSSLPSFPPE